MLEKILSIQHHLNPLHVYCRLIDRGVDKNLSKSVCKCYEILVYSWLAFFTVLAANICRLVKPGS